MGSKISKLKLLNFSMSKIRLNLRLKLRVLMHPWKYMLEFSAWACIQYPGP